MTMTMTMENIWRTPIAKLHARSRIINNAFWKCFSILIKYKVQDVLVCYVPQCVHAKH